MKENYPLCNVGAWDPRVGNDPKGWPAPPEDPEDMEAVMLCNVRACLVYLGKVRKRGTFLVQWGIPDKTLQNWVSGVVDVLRQLTPWEMYVSLVDQAHMLAQEEALHIARIRLGEALEDCKPARRPALEAALARCRALHQPFQVDIEVEAVPPAPPRRRGRRAHVKAQPGRDFDLWWPRFEAGHPCPGTRAKAAQAWLDNAPSPADVQAIHADLARMEQWKARAAAAVVEGGFCPNPPGGVRYLWERFFEENTLPEASAPAEKADKGPREESSDDSIMAWSEAQFDSAEGRAARAAFGERRRLDCLGFEEWGISKEHMGNTNGLSKNDQIIMHYHDYGPILARPENIPIIVARARERGLLHRVPQEWIDACPESPLT